MSIIPKLATSLNRRDEIPNQELAAEIVASNDDDAVKELVENLSSKHKGIRSDCIKVLYEIGYAEPRLIAPHLRAFLLLLTSKDNRLQWGAMSSLAAIVKIDPHGVFSALGTIIDAADRGSVITRDNCVRVLVSLAGDENFANEALGQLTRQLLICPTNQFPMYAELAMPAIARQHRRSFIQVLESRISEIEKESKRRRVENVILKVSK